MEKSMNFAQMEHLHSKYTGTGDSNTTKLEWVNGYHRDTYASILGHSNVMAYVGCAEGQLTSMARLRNELTTAMIAPLNPSLNVKYSKSGKTEVMKE